MKNKEIKVVRTAEEINETLKQCYDLIEKLDKGYPENNNTYSESRDILDTVTNVLRWCLGDINCVYLPEIKEIAKKRFDEDTDEIE